MTPQERAQLVQDIAAAIKSSPIALSDDEQRWVRMAIQREAERAELRKAVIEKTFAGLVWGAILGFGVMFVEFAKSHGWK